VKPTIDKKQKWTDVDEKRICVQDFS